MSLQVGIVGLPNVGKSTLFSALTKNEIEINNYPFCTIKPNIGVAPVADERLDDLWNLFPESKKIATIQEFVDIAGLVKNAHKGEGLGNQFLSNIRNVDMILEVVRAFPGADIKHVEDHLDPLRDIGIIKSELILSDLEIIAKRKQKLAKMKRSPGSEGAEAEIEWEILNIFEQNLNEEKWLNPLPTMPEKLALKAKDLSRNFSLITTKPLLYAINILEDQDRERLKTDLAKIGLAEEDFVFIDAKLEKELDEMTEEEKKELGLKSDLDNLVRQSYGKLGLLTFFTSGEKETRAWTTEFASSAPEAASAIHSDFERYFLFANIINWQRLIDAGGWKKAKEIGAIRREGKDYRMQEGDVVEFVIGKR